jgi:hypothetical protein
MLKSRLQYLLPFITGALFFALGIRDQFMPGFLCGNSHPHPTNPAVWLSLGVAFFSIGLVFRSRSKKDVGGSNNLKEEAFLPVCPEVL